jgi:hypothetical protein
MKYVLLMVLTMIICVGCGRDIHKENYIDTDVYGDNAPIINKLENKRFHVFGKIDPEIDLKLYVIYSTNNPICEAVTHVMQGPIPLFKTIPIKISRNINEYDAYAPLDFYESGKCGWLPYTINFEVFVRGDEADNIGYPPSYLVGVENSSDNLSEKQRKELAGTVIMITTYCEKNNEYGIYWGLSCMPDGNSSNSEIRDIGAGLMANFVFRND